MRKKLLKLSVLSMTSIVAVSFFALPLKASVVSNERPMAGITLSLDKYFANSLSESSASDPTPSQKPRMAPFRSLNLDNPTELDNNSQINDNDSVSNNDVIPNNGEMNSPITNNQNEIPIESPEAEETEDTEQKKVVLNLNYDRLGIAKVDNYLNIREKPSEEGKIIGKLPKDAGCHIYEIDENGWAKIKSGKVSGYVMAEFLVTDEEAESYALEVGTEMATVNTETLNVRFIPSTDSGKYTLVPNSEELEVVKETLTEGFVKKFIGKYFVSEEDKVLISNVDKEEMMKHLDDWMCVKIDNEKVFVAKEFVDISYQLKKAVFVEEVKEDVSKGVTSVRAQMVEFAKRYLGNRYVFGGTSLTNGIDCSAFVMRIYQNFGYNGLPRTSGAQAQYTTGVSDPKPGDLFFYGNGSRVNHVAMYIGNGQVIHASNERTGIKISNAYYRTPMKIGRVIND